MRSDRLYLHDILEACEAIRQFLIGIDYNYFADSELIRSAVLLKLIIIGEAAARISNLLKETTPSIEWADIISFRNFAIHVYFAVDWHIIWTTVTMDVPNLEEQIRTISLEA